MTPAADPIAEPLPRPLRAPPVQWINASSPVAYEKALAFMEARASGIAAGREAECVWLLEHPPLYTAGTSADPAELIDPGRFPVFQAGRGGRYTYHGPGQRVAYAMLDLNARGRDIRRFVGALEDWLIVALESLGIAGTRSDSGVGVFVDGAKIASIGVRVRRWVTFHGISLNVAPDLDHFAGIVPCGLQDTPVTSLKALGAETDMARVDAALKAAFERVFEAPRS